MANSSGLTLVTDVNDNDIESPDSPNIIPPPLSPPTQQITTHQEIDEEQTLQFLKCLLFLCVPVCFNEQWASVVYLLGCFAYYIKAIIYVEFIGLNEARAPRNYTHPPQQPKRSLSEVEEMLCSFVPDDEHQPSCQQGYECVICQQSLLSSEGVAVNGQRIAKSCHPDCQHRFHADCISQWLQLHDECPVCRRNYLEKPSSYGDDGEEKGNKAGSETSPLPRRIITSDRLELNNGDGYIVDQQLEQSSIQDHDENNNDLENISIAIPICDSDIDNNNDGNDNDNDNNEGAQERESLMNNIASVVLL